MAAREMWTCPACGRRFSVPRIWHSCGKYPVERLLGGKPAAAVTLYRAFERTILGLGPDVALAPAKTRVGYKVDQASPRCRVHHFRLRAANEIDEELVGWLRESYEMGR